jgi:hypothetical protein
LSSSMEDHPPDGNVTRKFKGWTLISASAVAMLRDAKCS